MKPLDNSYFKSVALIYCKQNDTFKEHVYLF